MTEPCSFGVLLKTECHKDSYTRSSGTHNIADLDPSFVEILLWRAGLRDHEENVVTICEHHHQYYGNVFERKSKTKSCAGVLQHTGNKVKTERSISLSMAKELESKGHATTPGQFVCRQCISEYERLINMEDDVPTDIDECDDISTAEETDADGDADFTYETEPETPKKKLNVSLESMDLTPVVLHGVAEHSRLPSAKRKLGQVIGTLKTNLATVYKVDSEELSVSSEAAREKEMKEKASELDRLHHLMMVKLVDAKTADQIQVMTLAPDSWSREYCSQFFGVSEYVVRIARELKRKSGILSKPSPKRGKKLSPETIELVLQLYEDDEYSRQMPGKKDYVSISKGVHKQKRLVLNNLHELYTAFKEKHPDIKVGFSKFCELRPKWCVLAGSTGTHSVCVCSIHQNAKLLVDAMDWDITYKDLIGKLVCDVASKECMMHRCEKCPGREGLQKFLDAELDEIEPDEEFHFSQWDTTDRATLDTRTTTGEEYKDMLIETIDNLTKHSYLAKAQAKFLNMKKDNLGPNEVLVLGDFAENYQYLIQDEIQSYHWSKEYCTLHPLVVYYRDNEGVLQHLSLCFISDDNTYDTSFVYQVQKMTISHIHDVLPHVNKMMYFSDGCGAQYKNYKNFLNLCLHKEDFGIDAEWVFFATSHGKSPCDGIGGSVKRHAAKRSLQRPLNDQILDYKAMLEVCKEMSAIKFFDISQEEMVVTRKFLEERYSKGDTVVGTKSSRHFVPISSSKIGHKLCSEDDSYVNTHDFDLPTILHESDLAPMQYVTCVHDKFWWIGMVQTVEGGEARVKFMNPRGGLRKNFTWREIENVWCIPIKRILCIVSPTTPTGRTYTITEEEYRKTISALDWYKKHNSE